MSNERIGVSMRQIRLRIRQLQTCKDSEQATNRTIAVLEEIATAIDSQERFWAERFAEQQSCHLAEVRELERRFNEQMGAREV